MKYLLFDIITIMASLVIADWHLLRDPSYMPTEAAATNGGANRTFFSSQYDNDCDLSSARSSSAFPSPSQSPITAMQPSNNFASTPTKKVLLRPGSIVEFYTDKSYFATPAIVAAAHETNDSASTQKYRLIRTINNDRLENVDESNVHPYEVYEDGTRASCNIGLLETPYMTPCAVLSHKTVQNGRIVMYNVSYLNEGGELVDEYIPFSRVQRIHGRRFGSHRVE